MKTLSLSDLDGTLLTPEAALSPFTAETLRRLLGVPVNRKFLLGLEGVGGAGNLDEAFAWFGGRDRRFGGLTGPAFGPEPAHGGSREAVHAA